MDKWVLNCNYNFDCYLERDDGRERGVAAEGAHIPLGIVGRSGGMVVGAG